MESSRSSYQTIRTTSSNAVETFVSLRFKKATKNRFDLLVKKKGYSKIFADFKNTFQMLQSTFQMESSRSSTQTMRTSFSNVFETFV